ncbi:esterase-like activity of phytase family protein [Taibaiella koreensis]|uniref:esterase-like activity of phytase family protein n=1 Tax=Taibaiella koreensis TaxID=1268548 RepID=UPI0013C2E4D5|nr:esterase-like activity of phytase family protein [Taibaiella koreensis]
MKKWLCLLPVTLYGSFLWAQTSFKFELIEQKEFSEYVDAACKEKFGGISAIEMIPDAVAPGNPEHKAGRQSSLYLVSDHYPNRRSAGVTQYSYSFRIDAADKVYEPSVFFGQNSVESVRYNEQSGKLFYSYEGDDNTGIGYIESGKGHILFEEPIPSDNRGIEGITFTSDNRLWAVCESGDQQSCGYTVPFYCFPPDSSTNGAYDIKARTEYQYPFDKCSCLDAGCGFNGSIGNGISEILALQGRKDKILVLERCFEGKAAHVRLFLATVTAGSRILTKQLVFDFNDNATFSAKDKAFTPDNLEGMAWGSAENGNPVLYLVSDNNFNPSRQRNQIVKLRMIAQ